MTFDSYYTPPKLAKDLINICQLTAPRAIADFAAGFGSLLEAAQFKYPNASYFANDISKKCLEYIKINHSNWILNSTDFLNINDVKELYRARFTSSKSKYDLILLNPPYSHRGGKKVHAFYHDQTIKCSPALAFVINSLNFLKDTGELIAILPSSCLTSDKDEIARKLIHMNYNLSMELKLSENTFDGCSVHTICIRISPLELAGKNSKLDFHKSITCSSENNNTIPIKLFCGKVSVPESKKLFNNLGYPFVHTTNLNNGAVTPSSYLVYKPNSTIVGPCILIPRVCNPSINKIVIYDSISPIVISDCIISIFPNSFFSIDFIYNRIHTYWPLLMQLYTGTCAQYITMNRMKAFFQSINVDASTIITCSEDNLIKIKKVG